MLGKKLILKIFEGFSIQRWNDLVRPFALVEMDKAAEKMADGQATKIIVPSDIANLAGTLGALSAVVKEPNEAKGE